MSFSKDVVRFFADNGTFMSYLVDSTPAQTAQLESLVGSFLALMFTILVFLASMVWVWRQIQKDKKK